MAKLAAELDKRMTTGARLQCQKERFCGIFANGFFTAPQKKLENFCDLLRESEEEFPSP